MNLFDATSIKALASVLKADEPYQLRRIFRWYSKTFHTPLHVLDDLPVEDILTAYYESHYEEMKADELREMRERVLETPEQRRERERKEESGGTISDDDFLAYAQRKADRKRLEIQAKKEEDKRILDTLLAEAEAPLPVPPEQSAEPVSEPTADIPDVDISYESSNLTDEDLDDLPSF